MFEIADKTQQWRAMALPVKLLAGTAALFVLLAVGMWATRKIDWYGGR